MRKAIAFIFSIHFLIIKKTNQLTSVFQLLLIGIFAFLSNSCEKPVILPAVITEITVSEITATTAKSGGTVTDDRGLEIIERGVCWSTTINPTTKDSVTYNGVGVGAFISNLTNLIPNSTYYLRAYATNKSGTAYGNEISFKTLADLATISTTPINLITATTAQSGGTITNDGNSTVIERGVCWSTTINPTVSNNKTEDGAGIGSYVSLITNLSPGTKYYVRAYAKNEIGITYGNNESFTTEIELPTVSTNSVSNVSFYTATCGGEVISDGGNTITTRGVCWSTHQNPTIADSKTNDNSGIGLFTSNINGLKVETIYFVRSYATNSVGTAYGNEVSFTTSTVVDVISLTGKIWMDRNLGAFRAATSSTDGQAYGDLYQWGRGTDGHEKRNSPTTSTISSGDSPNHGNFITLSSEPYDWRSPQNNNLWQGVSGVNNPCPPGYRLPTIQEWEAESKSWISRNATGAFASPLKLTVAGYRDDGIGSIWSERSFGSYWSSTVDGSISMYFVFGNNNATVYSRRRAFGYCVRCIKD